MLVLSRKCGEEIIIGEGPTRVVVTVCDIDRDRCRLGITCDRSIPIMRAELLKPQPQPTEERT